MKPLIHIQGCARCGRKLSNPSINKTGFCRTCWKQKQADEGHHNKAKPCIKCGAIIKRGDMNKTGLCGKCTDPKVTGAVGGELHTLGKEERKRKALITFEESGGNISSACAVAEVSREAWRSWKREDEDFKNKVIEIQEKITDYVEGKLLGHIKKNSLDATMFYLKTKGKDRGYYTYATQKVQLEAKVQIVEKTDAEIDKMSDDDLIAEIIK